MDSLKLQEASVRGIVHWWDDEFLIRSIGRRVEMSDDNGVHFKPIVKLSLGFCRNLASGFRLGRRLFRSNVKHCVRVKDNLFVLFVAGKIIQIQLSTGHVETVSVIKGSRPLRICLFGNSLFYGEYRSNSNRSPINIWRSDDFGRNWHSVYCFNDIRHVHGIFRDPFDDSIWITTGDVGREAAIWRTDSSFKSLDVVLQGSQQTRVIDILFEKDSFWFGTDAPDEPNFIYRVSKATGLPERVQQVAGPVFHAKAVGSSHLFSTACEPSKVNATDVVEVWEASGGNVRRMATFSKDVWSMKYFQYGQVLFPEGPGKGSHIWLTPYATKLDQQSFLFATR